jgi:hypothetical protein
MRRYKLKMNPLKCAFGVSTWKFLGFIVHEKGIEIDPKKIEAIQSVKAPTCKKDLQKFLGKVNYLRRFICNFSRKVNAFTPLLQLKNDIDFTWGAKQQALLEKVAICDDLLVTLLSFVTEWYVLYDEFSNFVIGGK